MESSMKKLLFLFIILNSFSVFAGIDLKLNLNAKIEDYSANDDIEVILFKPYWKCGPCALYEFIAAESNQSEIFDASTWLGKIFSDEVNFKSATIDDITAEELGLTGYPTTVIYKEGKYVGHVTGAITIPQIGEALDKSTKRHKYAQKGKNFMRNLEKSLARSRVQEF